MAKRKASAQTLTVKAPPSDHTTGSCNPADEISHLARGIEEADRPEPSASSVMPFPEEPASVAPPALPLNQDPQLVQDFLVEAREHISNVEARLLEIEQGATTAETLHSAFRSFHTIKGLAGFLEYNIMQEVSHEVESLLDLARNGKLALTPETVDVVLQAGDYLSHWLNFIESSLRDASAAQPGNPSHLIERVRRVALTNTGAVMVEEQALPLADHEEPAGNDSQANPSSESQPELNAGGGSRRSEASLVKVETAKLEYLVDMVGELVIAQSMVRHNPQLDSLKSTRLQRDIAHLSRVTAEVQKTAMAMRMVPIGQLFRRMTRLVRDLARKSGKSAELELFGEDVELDRTIVEQLADPLVHMLRNSLDHGLESKAEREAAGKSPVGHVRLKASHEAGQIVVEIDDDGRGLDRQRILRKAVERGLVSPEASLSDNEVFHLIFEPGFSTADKVTDVSGRGVGMDVVRKHISKLRGRIDIVSRAGAGTTFFLKLPLTLAIIDGLVVVVGGERYIVPIFAVREMFRAQADQIFTVEGRGEMVMVREHLLPVIRLGRRLGVVPKSEQACDGLMIVGESGGRTFCLLVDELVGKQEVVIKNLGSTFRDVQGLAGGAILGDGRVGLILDLTTLVQSTAVSGGAHAAA
jgi:two-component system chemotaxis sensor kinase CheA